MARKLSSADEKNMSLWGRTWQRIATGEIDLAQYTDEEILTGQIRMADNRLAPVPKAYPEVFQQEQVRRGMRQAQVKIQEGAQEAFDVYREIMHDTLAPRSDRLRAADFFSNRFLGKDVVKVQVAEVDKIEELFMDLLSEDDGLMPAEASTVEIEADDIL